MAQPFNKYSKDEDADLYAVMEEVRQYASENLPLPDGYSYERWNRIPYNKIREWHLKNGVLPDELSHLLKKNPNGKYASIEPDGGMIVAVKKDVGGNIIDWVPMLASEAKHQESDVGNAIERVFKNYNAIKDIFMEVEIFPYICFGQGYGLGSSFEQNKIIAGMGNDVNQEIDIYDKTIPINESNATGYKLRPFIVRKTGNFLVRKDRWEKLEMLGRLVTAMKQSYNYFWVKV